MSTPYNGDQPPIGLQPLSPPVLDGDVLIAQRITDTIVRSLPALYLKTYIGIGEFQNVADARAYAAGAEFQTIIVTSQDGGEFRRDPTDTSSADNGGAFCGTIIRPADGATNGVFKRFITGRWLLAWFGCFAGTGTDISVQANLCFRAAQTAAASIEDPGGIYAVGATLQFDEGAGDSPRGLFGAGINTYFQTIGGFTGTVFRAQQLAGVSLENFLVDGSGTAAICIDTSWTTLGPSVNNTYNAVWAQSFTVNGWRADNDNDSAFDQILIRGSPSFTLSGFRMIAAGGAINLGNIICSDSKLSITAQNGTIKGGYCRGVVFNELGTSTNAFTFTGYQIYASPATGYCFDDPTPAAPGHFVNSLTIDSCYLIPATGSTYVFNIGCFGSLQLVGTGWAGFTGVFGPGANNPLLGFGLSTLSMDGGGTDNGPLNLPTGFQFIRGYPVGYPSIGLVSDQQGITAYATTLTGTVYAPGAYVTLVPQGVMEQGGLYELLYYYNHNGAGPPYLVTGSARVHGQETIAGGGVIAITGGIFTSYQANTTGAFQYAALTGGTDAVPGIQATFTNQTVAAIAVLTVRLTRIARNSNQ